MTLRRILQKKPWISSSSSSSSATRRSVAACAYSPKHAVVVPPSPSPIASFSSSSSSAQKKNSFLGFPSSPIFLQVINSSCITNKCSFSNQAWVDPSVGGIIEVPLAQTGEGIAECELIKWFVQEGDQIEEFQPLCEVQSDKATIEITSRYKGKVSEILYDPGDIVKVGETLLKLVSEESEASTLISDGSNNTVSLSSDTCDSSNKSFLLDEHNVGGSTPAVRHLAKQYGININDIHGTGKDGRVLKDDVLNYAANKGMGIEPSAPSQASSVGLFLTEENKSSQTLAVGGWQFEDKTMPLRGFQRAMVKSMTLAAKVPHFHYVDEITCDALVELKASFQHENSDPSVKHTYMPFLIKSLSAALIKHPLLNSSFNEDLNEVILKGSHNIGVAMATPYGLVVPNIKKVQSLSILEITKELSRLQQLALNNKLSSQDISGGTITLSNIGAIGGKFGSPLLNLPEVAIIAVGRIEKLPRFADDGSVYPASITSVNIGADHRVVDGAAVARFCNEWKLLIENPEMLMLHMR